MVSDSDRMSRLGFPLIANNEVFEMLRNAKRGCGNFTLRVPMRLWHSQRPWLVCMCITVQFTTVIVASVFRGILAYGFRHFSWFSAYFANEWFALW